eukprot:Rmarinus@m.7293
MMEDPFDPFAAVDPSKIQLSPDRGYMENLSLSDVDHVSEVPLYERLYEEAFHRKDRIIPPSKDEEESTFHPQINVASAQLVQNRDGDTINSLLKWGELREKKMEQRRKEKEDNEVSQVRSVPKISSRSKRIARPNSIPLRDRLHDESRILRLKQEQALQSTKEAREEEEKGMLRDRPEINQQSSKMAGMRGTQALYEWERERQFRLERQRREKEEDEAAGLTFHPEVSSKATIRRSPYRSIEEGLLAKGDEANRKKEKLADEYEKSMPFTPQLSQRSRKLADRTRSGPVAERLYAIAMEKQDRAVSDSASFVSNPHVAHPAPRSPAMSASSPTSQGKVRLSVRRDLMGIRSNSESDGDGDDGDDSAHDFSATGMYGSEGYSPACGLGASPASSYQRKGGIRQKASSLVRTASPRGTIAAPSVSSSVAPKKEPVHERLLQKGAASKEKLERKKKHEELQKKLDMSKSTMSAQSKLLVQLRERRLNETTASRMTGETAKSVARREAIAAGSDAASSASNGSEVGDENKMFKPRLSNRSHNIGAVRAAIDTLLLEDVQNEGGAGDDDDTEVDPLVEMLTPSREKERLRQRSDAAAAGTAAASGCESGSLSDGVSTENPVLPLSSTTDECASVGIGEAEENELSDRTASGEHGRGTAGRAAGDVGDVDCNGHADGNGNGGPAPYSDDAAGGADDDADETCLRATEAVLAASGAAPPKGATRGRVPEGASLALDDAADRVVKKKPGISVGGPKIFDRLCPSKEEMAQKEAARRALVRERELADCTFRPAVGPPPMPSPDLARLHAQANSAATAGIMSGAAAAAALDQRASHACKGSALYEKDLALQRERDARLERERIRKAAEEEAECTFQPNLGVSKSRRPVTKRRSLMDMINSGDDVASTADSLSSSRRWEMMTAGSGAQPANWAKRRFRGGSSVAGTSLAGTEVL